MGKLHPRQMLRLAAMAVLALGVGAAASIYLLTGEPDDSGDNQTIIVNGVTYSVPANATKLYNRDLQKFGGKAALVFDDLNRWFSGLWHGRPLAGTILWISVIVSVALFFIAGYVFPNNPRQPDR